MRSILFAAAVFAIAAPAFADQGAWTATPAQPSTKSGFVAASVVWSCDGQSCASTSDTSGASGMPVCRAVAAEVGTLTAFATNAGPFNADKLAHCNLAAPKK